MRPSQEFQGGSSLKLSLIGHLAVVAAALLWSLGAWALTPKEPEVHVFQLQGVRSPNMTGSRKPPAGTHSAASQKLNIPSLDTRKAQSDAAKAAPNTAATKPAAKPATKPSTKPKAQAKPMSYAQFQAQQKKQKSATPASSSKPAKKSVNVPSIDADAIVGDMKSNLADTGEPLAAGSPEGVDTDGTYGDRVRALIDANFDEPSRVPGQVEAHVHFTITATGIVTGVSLVKSSGSGPFDSAALAAVRGLGQIEPPPGGKNVSYTIPFIATRDAE
jgi:TonB family protein